MASVAQGSNIALWGKNSLYQAGVVLDSSYLSNPTNYVAIFDTIKSDAFCVAGDSGGVVFSTTSYGTTGIACRYTPSGEYSVFVKVWNINNSLGVTNR